jgi:pyochelin biosynthetic protein PchC
VDEPWFTATPRTGARRALVAFPHAGAAARVYRDWPARLGAPVEVRAVRYPGHPERFVDDLVTDCRRLAGEIAAALVPTLAPEQPVTLFGHSMGALLAYEVGLLLENTYAAPAERVVVSGYPAPHLPGRDTLGSHRTDDEIVAALRDLGDESAFALDDPDLRELFLPVLRADFALSETYRPVPGVTLRGPLIAFGGADDDLATPAEMEAWRPYTTGAFTSTTFPGGHFYLHDESRDDVLAHLATLLDR